MPPANGQWCQYWPTALDEAEDWAAGAGSSFGSRSMPQRPSVMVGAVLPSDHSRFRLGIAMVPMAMLCIVVGIIDGSPSGDFIAGTGSGVLAMLLALHVASRRPSWSGGIPGVLGGMVAAGIGMGWQNVSSWSGLVGGVTAILASIIVDRDEPIQSSSEATQ